MKLILDTCVLLWMAGDPKRLSDAARNALSKENKLYVSAISAFEVAIKHKKKKLELPLEPWTWFQKVTDYFNIQEIPISAQIAALAPDVDVSHADPCDRIIISTATTKKLAVVSSDKLIRKCPQIDVVW